MSKSFVTWTVAVRLLCPWNSPGKNTGVVPFPSPGDLPDPGIEHESPTVQTDSLPSETSGKPQQHARWQQTNPEILMT